jgi:PncC family amidohydrolase
MISKKVFDKCIDKGLTIAFSESMTGGNLSFEMIKNEGSSKVLLGSIVAYHKDLKKTLLSVNPIIIDEHSVVSQEVADQMAYGIRNHTHADVCVSITGNAGPTLDFQTSKKEAYISILYLNKLYQYHLDLISDSRVKNIEDATVFVYQKIEEIL